MHSAAQTDDPSRMSIIETGRCALHAELHARGLLSADTNAPGNAPRLLPRVLALCFREYDFTDQHLHVVFESEEERVRIEQALLFGWVTADVLAERPGDDRSHLLCAIFNLGIGVVDSFCDADPQRGAELLQLIHAMDIDAAANGAWQEGLLLGALPASAAADPTIAFTARLIDSFFSLLCATHTPVLRRQVGRLLAEALAAEQKSVAHSSATPAELLEASRNTSVLPFLIFASLVGGDTDAATHLGEAMWRIDDLVDLEIDAQSGALNSLLLDGPPDRARIEAVAREAAHHLQVGLGTADGQNFLSFVHSSAQFTPEDSLRH